MPANFFVTLKGRDKNDRSKERSYSVNCKTKEEAEEWGKRCLAVQKKTAEDYKIQVTPIVIEEAAKIVAEAPTQTEAKPEVKEKKTRSKKAKEPKVA